MNEFEISIKSAPSGANVVVKGDLKQIVGSRWLHHRIDLVRYVRILNVLDVLRFVVLSSDWNAF